MPSDEILALDQQVEIDRLVERFEREFLAGNHLRIEECLQRQPELRQPLLRRLLALEFELRRRAGDGPSAEDYRRRFPEEEKLVSEVLSSKRTRTLDCRHDARDVPAEPDPERLGRYAVQRVLGRGGFGVVYLAHDPQLERLVAVKVPRRKRFKDPDLVKSFIAEARTAAKLKHPSLVAVYDVQEQDGLPYIVQEYIEGQNLSEWSAAKKPSFEQIARVMIGVAEALGYAHRQGLTHCDLKLANILMDMYGQPHVADFGLAVHDSAQALHKGEVFGTPAMMAPEQVRGESHRLDGRTDIWAIGVMLYELLVARRPFTAGSDKELFAEIQTHDPRPLRQIDRRVPRELERICLKCLSKRRTERYNTTDDLREDLLAWLAEATSAESPHSSTVANPTPPDSSSALSPVKIVPKGLRSFDAEDADFFLKLLPGPRDRGGLPDSIRFWKRRIEETDPDKTFSVGLIYGPSGCGKSSLVKAALLPRLCEDILPIYVEATASDTEVRIRKQLRRAFPHLNIDNVPLPNVLAEMRLTGVGHDRKVLLVLDQFEQWLHVHGGEVSNPLINALRQCDGERLQCIVMVRDDFWMAATRFMRELEVRLVEAVNSTAVDLFDQDHARRVLAEFGRAYGRLSEELTAEDETFLEQSVKELAQEGKVVCIRLTLFADMMKSRPWTPAELQRVGGIQGIGVTFLEETFSASTAPPEHRLHQKAARAVLKAMLPEAGADIKGHMRSYGSLLGASGYTARPQEFVELMRILDSEVRLITPTDSEGIDSESEATSAPGQKYYQLTHDYLVPSLRAWLKKKQEESREGRAEVHLAELAEMWRGDKRLLPYWLEYLSILRFTQRGKWTENERAMMDAARSYYRKRWSGAIAAILLITFAIQQFISAEQRQSQLSVMIAAVDTLQNSRAAVVVDSLSDLDRLPRNELLKELRARYAIAEGERKLPLAYGLARLGSVDAEFLTSQIVSAAGRECPNIVSALDKARPDARVLIESKISEAEALTDWRAKARLAIVDLYLGHPDATQSMLRIDAPDPVQRATLIDTFPGWNAGLDRLADVVENAADPALRSGVCLAIGSLSPPAESVTKDRWHAILAEWCLNQPDAGTHAAADWALRQWKLPRPKAYLRRADKDFDWLVTPSDLTMVRIAAGAVTLPSGGEGAATELEVARDYLISDREISVGLFQNFLDDDYDGPKPTDWEAADPNVSPSDAHPVQRTSWVDAVQFCNWLSAKEGLVPCYRNFDGEDGTQVWKFVEGTNGYSLPTEAQWEYACRAGSVTRFSSGDDDALVASYAVFRLERHTRACATTMCNGWGLFDMHGNLWEWCCDRRDVVAPTSSRSVRGTPRPLRGGCYANHSYGIQTSSRDLHLCTHRSSALGFRVVRHLIAPAAKAEKASGTAPAATEEHLP